MRAEKPSKRDSTLPNDDCPKKFESAVIQELLETEEKYIFTLLETHGGYNALLNSLNEFQSASTCVGLMKSIAELSNSLLTKIYENDNKYFSLISAFQSLIPQMKQIYGNYVCSYSQAISELQYTTNLTFKSDVIEIQKCFGHVLTLESYILQPVQRVMRYKLLMNSLLQECKNSVDGFIIKNLVKELDDLNEYINELSRQREADDFFVQMNLLIKNLTKPLKTEEVGALILKDEFTRRKKKLSVFLFSKFIMVTKKLKNDKLLIKHFFDLEKVNIIENNKAKKNAFGIVFAKASKEPYWLFARDKESKNVWLTHIKACILDCFKLKLDDSKIKCLVGEEVANKITTILSVSDDLSRSRNSDLNCLKSDDDFENVSTIRKESLEKLSALESPKVNQDSFEESFEPKIILNDENCKIDGNSEKKKLLDDDMHVSYGNYLDSSNDFMELEHQNIEVKYSSNEKSSSTSDGCSSE